MDFWGKNKGLRSTVIKGILSSGVRIVSFTESTADAEIVKECLTKKRLTNKNGLTLASKVTN